MSLDVRDISYSYYDASGKGRPAIRDISFSAERGEHISVIGRTGSGKSTLALCLDLILLPDKGEISADGLSSLKGPTEIRQIRRAVGVVFQDPDRQFFADTVRDELEFAPKNWGMPADDMAASVKAACELTGITDSILDRSPFSLSGGWKRRVAIASLLSAEPSYLVLDEAYAGLDHRGASDLDDLIERMRRDGRGVITVTHDLDLALTKSDKILILEDGKMLYFGDTQGAIELIADGHVSGMKLPSVGEFCLELKARGLDIPIEIDPHKASIAVRAAMERKINV